MRSDALAIRCQDEDVAQLCMSYEQRLASIASTSGPLVPKNELNLPILRHTPDVVGRENAARPFRPTVIDDQGPGATGCKPEDAAKEMSIR